MRLWSRATSAIPLMSDSLKTPPVGFCGEFRMSIRVFVVTRRFRSSRSNPNPFSSRNRSGTAFAPTNSTADS